MTSAAPVAREPWPVWAKALMTALLVLAILTLVPWIFMTFAMATSCLPMMNGMQEMMRDGMMR